MKIDYSYEIKATEETKKILCVGVSIVATFIFTVVSYVVLKRVGFNYIVTSENSGDYIGIFSMHCSIVFLTTSLMAMLSENNKYIYWVEMVTAVLISPPYMNFLALAIYSISTVVWAMFGLVFRCGSLVIGSFLVGLISVTVLFSRMMAVYYQNEQNKNSMRLFLIKQVKEDDIGRYISRLREITFIKAEAREFSDVYDNLRLMEECILAEWGKERAPQAIFQPRDFLECSYVNLLIDLSMTFTQEMQDYIEYHINTDEDIRSLCYLSYPTILNTFINNGREDSFCRVLNKWAINPNQKKEVLEYMNLISLTREIRLMAEYIHLVYNPCNYEIQLREDDSIYIEYLEELYYKEAEKYEELLAHKGNRQSIYLRMSKKEKEDIRNVIVISETQNTKCNDGIFQKHVAHILNQQIVRYEKEECEQVEIQKGFLFDEIILKLIENRTMYDAVYLFEQMLEDIFNIYSYIYINANDNREFFKELFSLSIYNVFEKNKKVNQEDKETLAEMKSRYNEIKSKYDEIIFK